MTRARRKKLPEINLKELERFKKQNFKERLEFQDWYVNWMKKTGNVKWSSAQKTIINRKSSKRPYHSRSARTRYTKLHTKN
jgi:hypothetical protein